MTNKNFKRRNVYRDYYGFDFTKVYWSKLVPLHIDKNGLYKCDCCNKHPLECENKASVAEYKKLQMIFDKTNLLGGDIDVPIYETGYCRADLHADVELVWKIQRKLADLAGFTLHRSSFW